MYIKKKCMRVNAFRLTKAYDIPYCLRDTVKILDGRVCFQNATGTGVAELNTVYGWEKTDKSPTGYSAWPVSDESHLCEVNGEFYTVPKVCEAYLLIDEVPTKFASLKDKLTLVGDVWNLETDWGLSQGKVGEVLIVKYGVESDGSLMVALLIIDTPAFDDYEVCTANGTVLESLSLHLLGKSCEHE